MQAQAAALLTAAACMGLAGGTPAAARDAHPVTARPPLDPAFRLSRPDYTVRCQAGQPVELSLDPPPGTQIAVRAGKPRGRPYTASVDLAPGRAVAIRFVRSHGTTVYRARCLPADFPDWYVQRSGTPQARWYLVAPDPRGHGDPIPGPGYAAIFDSHGVPVWWYRQSHPVSDADLLPNGHLVWTDFSPHIPHVAGFYERTLDGRKVHTWTTGGSPTNQHDFQLLPNGHVLLVTYRQRHNVDLRRWGGPADAEVLDGEVQEVDRTGSVKWSWNTKDHIKLAEASRWLPGLIRKPDVYQSDGTPVYDVMHLNSIDPVGKVLVMSIRYTDAVYGVDRGPGRILWRSAGRTPTAACRFEATPARPRTSAASTTLASRTTVAS
jgi:hypothetical protein